MARSLRTPSLWDSIPSETVLDVCSFLPIIDLLNLCAAYHEIEQLASTTSTLWWTIHLPYPDPQLYNYPGWRHRPPVAHRSTFHQPTPTPSRSDQFNNPITIFQDARYRFMAAASDNSDLHGSETMENGSAHPEFIAWIILDVLNSIPLHFTRHLSFDSPPCHLCVYPCRRFCACECHQNEQSNHQHDSPYQFQHRLNLWNPSQQEELVPISQPLQNLFESGLVDFSRHINVRLLSQALAMPTSTATSQSTGISHLSFISQPSTNNLNNIVHDELSLEDALLQLSNIEDEETAFEEQSQHGYSQFLYPETTVQTHGIYAAGATELEASQETCPQLSEEEQLEESRQQLETRASYLRARLLMRILSLRDLESLETLRAPWWPAARIYTIRQQLERWSFVVEQALATSHNEGAVIDQQQLAGSTPMYAPQQTPAPSPRTHWTNRLFSGEDTSTISTRRPAAAHSSPMPEALEEYTQPQMPETAATLTPLFPLASLTKFTLRCGGEMSSHDRHCLGISAMILSGRSSANSSQAGTPPPPTTIDPRTLISSDSNPLSLTATHLPWKGEFRYCHHCGSQYLQISTAASNACFCRCST